MANDPEISQAELNAMLVAIELGTVARTPELITYLRGLYTQAAIEAEGTLYNAIAAQMTNIGNEAAQAAARARARSEAATLAKNFVQAELNKVADVVAWGVENGLNPREVARHLDMVKGLDSNRAKQYLKFQQYLENVDPPLSAKDIEKQLDRKFQKLLKERKDTIAQTETQYALSESNELSAKERGDKYKCWMTSGHNNVCDICEGNEADGWIDIKAEFSGGVTKPPQHPDCHCSVTYRAAEPNEAAIQRAKDRSERTRTAKEGEAA